MIWKEELQCYNNTFCFNFTCELILSIFREQHTIINQIFKGSVLDK